MKTAWMGMAVAFTLVSPIAANAQVPPMPLPDCMGRLGLRMFKSALEETGVAKELTGKGPYTVFAPSNSAIVMMDKGRFDALKKDKKALTAWVKLHIAKGIITAGDVGKMPNGGKIKTLGGTLTVQTKGTLLINGSKPYMADQKATNGIVHLMDRALAK